jgi:hypothetical protein
VVALVFAASGLSISPAVWYVARASGFTAYLLLWLAVVAGLGLTTRLLDFVGGPALVLPLHRFITELGVSALALHIVAVALDPTVAIGLGGALLPFSSAVRQPWTDLGILTAYGFVLVAASFAFRGLLGRRGWRRLHFLAFPLWGTATIHGIGAGTDSSAPWAIALYLATTALVVFLSLFRLLTRGARQHGQALRAVQSKAVAARPER